MRNPANTRTCAGCGRKADKSEFIRIGKKQSGEVIIGNHGRGAYICNNEKCLTAAIKKKRFNNILRTPVPEEIYNQLKNIMGSDEN